MHPDEIVGTHDFIEFGRKVLVDPHIARQVATREFGEIEAIMQHRPEHAVGKAVVIFLVVLGPEAGHDVVDVLVPDSAGLECLSLASDLAAPAEPKSLAVTQCGLDGHFEAAGTSAGLPVRHRDAVGDYDEPRQYRSSQLLESRIALRMIPAIE